MAAPWKLMCKACWRRLVDSTGFNGDLTREMVLAAEVACGHSLYRKQGVPAFQRINFARSVGAVRGGPPVELRCVSCPHVGGIRWDANNTVWMLNDVQLDHIIPERHGGSHAPDNLQPMCRRCNLRKGSKVA